jgi:hypothetical protein
MEKKTVAATQWLFDQLWDTPKDKFTWHAILEQANKIHEEQIIDAYLSGMDTPHLEIRSDKEYYNDTFK